MRYNIGMSEILNPGPQPINELCKECVEIQPNQNCWYQETLQEIAAEVQPLSPGKNPTIERVVAEIEQDPLERGLEANRRMILAYNEARKMDCPKITEILFPNIPGL